MSLRALFHADRRACERAKIDTSAKRNRTLKGAPLDDALEALLKDQGLQAVVRDEVIFVTPAKLPQAKQALPIIGSER